VHKDQLVRQVLKVILETLVLKEQLVQLEHKDQRVRKVYKVT
jgi:hypothetical protein